jgi:D-alanyl-D-alanine-carboxypeptidase/D-alanyl-D-alanine-endopeptidase
MQMIYLWVVCLLTALAWCRPLGAQAPLPRLEQQATELGTELFAHASSTGMVLVVVRGHEVFVRGFGVVPTQDSLLRLCSLSKIFATDLLVKLVQEGTVHLDDPLQRFAPEHVQVPAREGRSITLQDLATHTAGLTREVGTPPRHTPHFTYPDHAERWRWLPLQELYAKPGTAAVYSNIGFDLLGDAMEQATQEPYARLLYERTTAPLGLRETGFTPTAEQCGHLLRGTRDEGPCTDTQNTAASSGLYSTGADMVRWLQYLLGTEAPAQVPAAQAVYLRPAQLRSQQGLDHAGRPSGIGLGWMHLRPEGDPAAIVEKTGGGAGFVTYIALNPAQHTGLFFAMTEGRPDPQHVNVFKAANDLLLALNGLPPLPVEVKRVGRVRRR